MLRILPESDDRTFRRFSAQMSDLCTIVRE